MRKSLPQPPSENYYDGIFGQREQQLHAMESFQRQAMNTPASPEWLAFRDMNMQHNIDLHWLHDLYKAVIIPEVERFGFVKRKTAEQSRYVDQIDLDHEELSDINEVMRLGYVHLFHRIEAYKKRLFPAIDLAFGVSGDRGIIAIMKRYYGLDLSMSFGHPVVREIAFIATSTKHTDGYPSGANPPKRFDAIDPKKKIKVSGFELLEDINKMKPVSIALWHMLSVVHHRSRLDDQISDPSYLALSGLRKEKIDIEHKMRTGSATCFVRQFFTDVPVKVKAKWPSDPNPWPLPKEDFRKLFEPLP